jgi:hypothetical protein
MLRLIRIDVVILICLLSVCVACSGHCVSTSLQDYLSSDFTLVASSNTGIRVNDVTYVKTLVEGRQVAPKFDSYEFAVSCLRVRTIPRAAEDLLHLLSIQRT